MRVRTLEKAIEAASMNSMGVNVRIASDIISFMSETLRLL